jgi:hypothetical protein
MAIWVRDAQADGSRVVVRDRTSGVGNSCSRRGVASCRLFLKLQSVQTFLKRGSEMS